MTDYAVSWVGRNGSTASQPEGTYYRLTIPASGNLETESAGTITVAPGDWDITLMTRQALGSAVTGDLFFNAFAGTTYLKNSYVSTLQAPTATFTAITRRITVPDTADRITLIPIAYNAPAGAAIDLQPTVSAVAVAAGEPPPPATIGGTGFYLAGDPLIPLLFSVAVDEGAVEPEPEPEPTGTYSTEVAADFPQAWWRMGDTGSTLADVQGVAPLTLAGGPTTGQPGLITTGTAVSFDGVDDAANGTGSAVGGGTSVSMEAWVRLDTLGKTHILIANCKDDVNDGAFLCVNAGNTASFFVGQTSALKGNATSTTTLAAGTTYHLVGTYDGTTVRLFINGTQAASTAYTGGVGWLGDRSLALGKQVKSFNQSSRYLDGTLDEAAIYTTALSAARVAAHYTAGTT